MDAWNWTLTYLLAGGGTVVLGQLLKAPQLKGWKARAFIFLLCMGTAFTSMKLAGTLPALGWSWAHPALSFWRLAAYAVPVFLTAHTLYVAAEEKLKALLSPLPGVAKVAGIFSWIGGFFKPKTITPLGGGGTETK